MRDDHRPHLVQVFGVKACRVRGALLFPQGVAPKLNEVRIALARVHRGCQRLRLDVDALILQRPRQRVFGGLLAQQADAELAAAQPLPEGCVHRVEMRRQARRASENEQKRRFVTHGLAGVQQRPADRGFKGVRLVDQHGEWLGAATSDQPLFQARRGVRRGVPLHGSHRGYADLAGKELRQTAAWREQVRQRARRRRLVRRQCDHVGGGFRAAGDLLEPVEQNGLAVAPRPDQHHIVRGRRAGDQIRQAISQNVLLGFASGQHGRRGTAAGCEQALPRSWHPAILPRLAAWPDFRTTAPQSDLRFFGRL